MKQKNEDDIATMEAIMIYAADQYFEARRQLIGTNAERNLFEAGFRAGYNCRQVEIDNINSKNTELIEALTKLWNHAHNHRIPEDWNNDLNLASEILTKAKETRKANYSIIAQTCSKLIQKPKQLEMDSKTLDEA